MALVGSYVALSKVLLAAFPVFLLAWLRFGIAAVAMLHWLRRVPGEAPLSRRDRVLLFWESFIGNFLFSICMLAGLSLTSASAAGVILSTLPAVVALLGWLLLRERIRPRVWGAVALATAGVALLSLARPANEAAAGISVSGNLLVFGCVICEAVYVILGKRLTASLSPLRISALINAIGLVLMTPLGLWQALDFDFAAVAAQHWLLLAFYAVSASVLSTWLWLSGLRRVPASHSGVFTIAMPLAATAVGVGLLGERVGWAHGVALALAHAGLALIASAGREREQPAG